MQDQAPIVGRPRGNAWRVLQADGIEWEGQIYLIGEQIDLAMRLIVTRRRIAFARGGGIALEIDRAWLSPPPVISRLGDVTLYVAAEQRGEPEKLRLQFRDGRLAADQLVRLLGGGPERPAPRRTAPVWDSWSSSNFAWLDAEPAPPSAEPGPFVPSTGWEAYDRGLPAGPSILESDDFPPIAHTEAGRATPVSSTSRPAEPDGRPEPLGPVPARGDGASARSIEAPTQESPWLVSVDGLSIKPEYRTRRSVAIRLGGLAILLAAAAAFGADKWPDPPGSEPSVNAPIVAQQAAGGDGTGGSLPDVSPDEEDVELGVGGENGEIATSNTPTPEPEAEETEAPAEPTVAETEAADEELPAETATDAVTAEPTETATEEAVETPEPTAEPTETETPEPTEAPAEVVTPPQGPSVASGEIPDQVVATGAFRYTVESVQRAPEIQGLGLPNVGYGDWVVVVINAQNWSDDAAAFDMKSFTLQTTGPSGQQVPLDSGTEQVAQALGLVPAYGATSSALFAGGEAHRVALVFLVTPDTEGIALQVGDQQVDLQRALEEAVDPATLGDAPEAGRLFEGQVTDVIDGETFTVDVEGVTYTVRINGIDAPEGDSCYSGEATERATALLEGQTVLIERQRTNLDDDNNLLRDVWIVDGEGAPAFAAASLVAEGAAEAAPDDSNTRYAGWIASAQTTAQASGAGLWGACGSE